MNCEEFSTPVTEEMFMAYMIFNCPTLFDIVGTGGAYNADHEFQD